MKDSTRCDDVEEKSLQIENQVCFSLYSASNALIRAYKPLLKELDLTYLQYMTMMVLWQSSPITVKQIGDKLHLDSGTLTPLLKRLQDKGMVNKVRSEKDERKVFLHLTEQGIKLKAKAKSVPHALMCKVNMSVEHALQLKALSDLLLKQLTT
ncbi:MarR family transcriptional regulator [Psychrosphaera ytuae]|uniref:MarR family transcriptional regulator n=1 Tax=Psychrosphaera ytuae TaxID=2820710 RepID=A0A975DE76_9GAMM|nr:MarR family transcriptional regulator [Psychrosphaera ytuae]QTH64015.1 MarR family transcriptional regulator [Psychrosphaera ytuae]